MTTTAQLDTIIQDLKDRAARIERRTATTTARFEAYIEGLKAHADRIESRAGHSDVETLAALHQDIGMFSRGLDRAKA